MTFLFGYNTMEGTCEKLRIKWHSIQQKFQECEFNFLIDEYKKATLNRARNPYEFWVMHHMRMHRLQKDC